MLLARTDVLVLDDSVANSIDALTRGDLIEIIDDRVGERTTIITHQLPMEHWHDWPADAKPIPTEAPKRSTQ